MPGFYQDILPEERGKGKIPRGNISRAHIVQCPTLGDSSLQGSEKFRSKETYIIQQLPNTSNGATLFFPF